MKDRCDTDQPEAYAPHYLLNEEHVKLFEQCKLLHDEAQKKGLVFFLIMESPDKEATLPIALFHLSRNPNNAIVTCREEFDKIINNFQWLVQWTNNFFAGISQSWRKLQDQEGEEWKNER